MNAYDSANEVEAEAMRILIPYAREFYRGGELVLTNGMYFAQKVLGDMIAKNSDGRTELIEVKAEAENKYGNLFLESWSSLGLLRHGWMHTCLATTLWYHFNASRELYIVPMDMLRRWAFAKNEGVTRDNIDAFPQRLQAKYKQANDTWGWCVPIRALREKVEGFRGPIDAAAETERAQRKRSIA